MAIEMVYFAWVRERIGLGSETVDPPADIVTVADLIDWLAADSAAHAAAFVDWTRLAGGSRSNVRGAGCFSGRRARSGDLSPGDRRMITVGPVPIDMSVEFAAIAAKGAGGVATFVGLVRADDGVVTLELEHYPGATEAALAALAAQAVERWGLIDARITHRVGAMAPGDIVVFVGTAAAHRAAALDACAFLIDRLKTEAPFWKKETRGGNAAWVEPRGSDNAAAARWIA